MAEITYAPIPDVLTKVDDYSESYSHHISKKVRIGRWRQRASLSWSGNGLTRRYDPVMYNAVFKYMRSDSDRKAFKELVDTLIAKDYAFKKDVGQLAEAVSRYGAQHPASAGWRRNYQEALRVVGRMVAPNRFSLLRPIKLETLEQVRAVTSNPKASSGMFGVYTSASRKQDMDQSDFRLASELIREAIERGYSIDPTIPGTRLQITCPITDDGNIKYTADGDLDYKQKTRMINVVSYPRIILESRFSVPFQGLLNGQWWYEPGKQMKDVSSHLSGMRARYHQWDSLDYSKYDQSLPGWFIWDVFQKIVKPCFVLNPYEDEAFDTMCNDFIHKTIVVSKDGDLLKVHDGVESGSMFTNMIDSLCNLVMLTYFMLLKGGRYRIDYECSICGDDNIIFSNGLFNGEDYLHFIEKVFGVKGSPEKSSLAQPSSKDPEYLSRTWKWDGIWRSPYELICKLIWHEHDREYNSESDAAVTPEEVLWAFYQCYNLGMAAIFDIDAISHALDRTGGTKCLTNSVARKVGGIVAYETIYNRH